MRGLHATVHVHQTDSDCTCPAEAFKRSGQKMTVDNCQLTSAHARKHFPSRPEAQASLQEPSQLHGHQGKAQPRPQHARYTLPLAFSRVEVLCAVDCRGARTEVPRTPDHVEAISEGGSTVDAAIGQRRRHGNPAFPLKVKALDCGDRSHVVAAAASADVDAPTEADGGMGAPRPRHRRQLLPSAASVGDVQHLSGGVHAGMRGHVGAQSRGPSSAHDELWPPRNHDCSMEPPRCEHLSRQDFAAALAVGKLWVEALYRSVDDARVHVLASADVEAAVDDCRSRVRALHAQAGRGRAGLPPPQPEVELLHDPPQLAEPAADIHMATNGASHVPNSPNLHGWHGLPLARAQVEALHRLQHARAHAVAAAKRVEPPCLHGLDALACSGARLLERQQLLPPAAHEQLLQQLRLQHVRQRGRRPALCKGVPLESGAEPLLMQ
mmetsp:Transcript_24684/g.51294  ORF Transcript_24684/g.51294 Transcript_24684/m.51294 type:complete len:438 (+) Transcript_24684:281-1594(+)